MSVDARKRAVESYRSRLSKRGIARFQVQAPERDRELIRALAHKLAEPGPDAARVRSAVEAAVGGGSSRTGGILAALRRSPLVGAELDLTRLHEEGREIDL